MASSLVSSTGKMKRLRWIIFAMFMPFKSAMRTPSSRCTVSLNLLLASRIPGGFGPCLRALWILFSWWLSCVWTLLYSTTKSSEAEADISMLFQNQLLKFQILLCDNLQNTTENLSWEFCTHLQFDVTYDYNQCSWI